MNTTTVAIDLAKDVLQLAVADAHWRVTQRARLSRSQLMSWLDNRVVGLVVMEACGLPHHWARWLEARGTAVWLLPAAYVRAYVKRNKTDAADAAALLEAYQPARTRAYDGRQAERCVQAAAVDSCCGPADSDGDGRGHRRQRFPFQGCASLRQLVRLDAEGIFFR